MVTLLLVLLYSVIESGIYSSALKALESFCSLCDRALPAARKDFLNELRPELEKLARKQDVILDYLAELENKLPDCRREEIIKGAAACPPYEEEETRGQ